MAGHVHRDLDMERATHERRDADSGRQPSTLLAGFNADPLHLDWVQAVPQSPSHRQPDHHFAQVRFHSRTPCASVRACMARHRDGTVCMSACVHVEGTGGLGWVEGLHVEGTGGRDKSW